MKKEQASVFKFVVGFAWMLIALWSCKDEMSTAGLGLLPDGDVVTVRKVTEQSTVSAFTFNDTIQRTDETSFNLLGTFNDPIFGKTVTDFAFQVRINTFPDFREKDAKPDSLILYLLYKVIYGDTITPQKFTVYELETPLDFDQDYYQDVNLKALAKGEVLAELVHTPKFRLDSLSTTYGSTKKEPKDTVIQELAFKMKTSLMDRLWNADSTTMSGNDKGRFLDFFKGMYVEVGDLNQGGTIMSIYTLAAGSSMIMHYQNSEEDSLRYFYNINTNSARVNRFVHDYSKTSFFAKLNQTDVQDSLLYLQTTGGLASKFFIPNLGTWKDSANFAINKAELVFQVDSVITDLKALIPPDQIILRAIDEDGNYYFPSDLSLSQSYFGGVYNSEDKTYRFNIAKHIQDVIEQKADNFGFYLSTANRNNSFRRVVLKGATSKSGIRLDITYSKLK